jgi:hypothetical protein
MQGFYFELFLWFKTITVASFASFSYLHDFYGFCNDFFHITNLAISHMFHQNWPLPFLASSFDFNFSNFVYFILQEFDFDFDSFSFKSTSNFLGWFGCWSKRGRNNNQAYEMQGRNSKGLDSFGQRRSDPNGWKQFNAVDRKSFQRGNSSDVFNNKYNNKNYTSDDAYGIGYGYGYNRVKSKGEAKELLTEKDITEDWSTGTESLEECTSNSSSSTSYYIPVKYKGKGKAKELLTEKDITEDWSTGTESLDECTSNSSPSTSSSHHNYSWSEPKTPNNSPTESWEIIEIPNISNGVSGSKNKASSLDSLPDIQNPNSSKVNDLDNGGSSSAGSGVGGWISNLLENLFP